MVSFQLQGASAVVHAVCFPRRPEKESHRIWREQSTQVSRFLQPRKADHDVNSEEHKTSSPGLDPNVLPPCLKYKLTGYPETVVSMTAPH